MPPPEPSDAHQRFQATRWSVVLRTRGNDPEARRALEDLRAIYWFPLYTWCRARGHPPADSEDFIQGFFLKAIDKNLFAAVAHQRRDRIGLVTLPALPKMEMRQRVEQELDFRYPLRGIPGEFEPLGLAEAATIPLGANEGITAASLSA